MDKTHILQHFSMLFVNFHTASFLSLQYNKNGNLRCFMHMQPAVGFGIDTNAGCVGAGTVTKLKPQLFGIF